MHLYSFERAPAKVPAGRSARATASHPRITTCVPDRGTIWGAATVTGPREGQRGQLSRDGQRRTLLPLSLPAIVSRVTLLLYFA